jgi:hypothetical protein
LAAAQVTEPLSCDCHAVVGLVELVQPHVRQRHAVTRDAAASSPSFQRCSTHTPIPAVALARQRAIYLQSNTLAALAALKTGCALPVNSVCHDALIRIDAGCAVRVCKRLPGRRRHRRLLQRYLQLLALQVVSSLVRGTLGATALYAADVVWSAQALTMATGDCCVASDVTAVPPASLHL